MESSKHKPVLIVIAGPNGSGKTTITTRVLQHEWLEDSVYINPDNVAQNLFGGWNDQEAVLKAAQYCEKEREENLYLQHNMIFETVMSTRNKIDFIRRAKENGFFIRLFFVGTSSPTINASRIASRVMKGGHDVPITKIISRYYKSIANCKTAASLADRTYVYDNSIDGKEAQLLFRMTNGEIFKQYVEEVPDWAKDIANKS